VEPNYEKKLGTLEELLDSDVVYGYNPGLNFALDTLSYPEFVKFVEHKELKEDCGNFRKCAERMITKRDIASFVTSFYINYIPKEFGIVDVGKVICPLDQVALYASMSVVFKKGNPLLGSFNRLMRRYIEAGLLEMLWTDLQHRASLKGAGRLREAAGDKFFAFSLSHIKPAFVVLLVGSLLSSFVFIAEVIVSCPCNGRKKRIRAL
jgi:hypothetical protein